MLPIHRTPEFARFGRTALERMAACGHVVMDCENLLARNGVTVLGEVLREAGPVYEWHHYPDDDVHDPLTHAQYFYHSHPRAERGAREHGHFHTFLRARGMPRGLRPLVMPELAIADNPAAPAGPLVPSAPQSKEGEGGDPWSHLIAIAMAEGADASGRAIRLFTTNRWVTGETWYTAGDVAAMLDRFDLGAVGPSPLLNRWVSAMIGLFKAQIIELLHERDEAVMGWRRRRRGKVHVFEDRRLEVTSFRDIDVEAQLRSIESALRAVA